MKSDILTENTNGPGNELPKNVLNPTAKFLDSDLALSSYSEKLEVIAKSKGVSLGELIIQANKYKFGPDESFEILGLIDTINALKLIK
jgi:hypothetical protein